ncbi:MAG: CHAT domain-containing protein, partial [Nodosilinea sp.]
MTTTTGKIFISYRQDDSAGDTGRIYDCLAQEFGSDNVFKDVDSIPFGVDFAQHIDQEVGRCQVLLVVMGKNWVTPRLQNPDDFVRLEIESALGRGIPVVPVFLEGVTGPPSQDQLPESLHPLIRRNGTQVGYDPRFHADMDRLIKGLRKNYFQQPSGPVQCPSANIKILILAANPSNTPHLRLDQEVRDIEEGLIRAQQRDRFELVQRWAARPRDVQLAILELKPQIVHFSGHGVGERGLVLEDGQGQAQLVSTAALANLFALFADQVQCVLLNACYSEVQGQAIAQHIPYVIGMKQAIGDTAAREFAVGFYNALGAGRDIEFAFKYACSSIQMAGIAEHLTPVLYVAGKMTPPALEATQVNTPES